MNNTPHHTTLLLTQLQAKLSCHVILACRNTAKAQSALEKMKAAHPAASLEVIQLDLASLDSARQFAKTWAHNRQPESNKKLDLLICNGGATFVDLAKTDDGFERTYQVSSPKPRAGQAKAG